MGQIELITMTMFERRKISFHDRVYLIDILIRNMTLAHPCTIRYIEYKKEKENQTSSCSNPTHPFISRGSAWAQSFVISSRYPSKKHVPILQINDMLCLHNPARRCKKVLEIPHPICREKNSIRRSQNSQ